MMEQKLSALGAFDEENPHRVINVNYVDLVERPVEEVLRVYAETEFSADTDLGVSVNSFIEQQKAGHRAKPRRELSSYGYVQDEVLAKPTIANYMNRFNVTKEMTRRTGAD